MFLTAPKANQAQFVAVTDGVYSRCVFGARELLELSKINMSADGQQFSGVQQYAANSPALAGSSGNIAANSAFKPLPPGTSSARLSGSQDVHQQPPPTKDEEASDEEVASLSLAAGTSGGHTWRPTDPQQVGPSSSGAHAQQPTQQMYPSPPKPAAANRVVVVPPNCSSSIATSQRSFQPIRSSPPITTIKTEVREDKNVPQHRNLGAGNDRLEDFANFVVEAASRSVCQLFFIMI